MFPTSPARLATGSQESMRIFPSEQYPDWVELVYGGAVVGLTTWAWLNKGVSAPPSVGPAGYDCE